MRNLEKLIRRSLSRIFAFPEADFAAKFRARIGWKLGAQPYIFFPSETLCRVLCCIIVSQLGSTVLSESLVAAVGHIRVSSSRQVKAASADCISCRSA